MRYLIYFLMIFIVTCADSNQGNKVPLQQLNNDKSNNYNYIFKDTISREKEIEKKKARDPFKD